MTPGSANFRRANRNPSYQCLPRAEYVQRAVEMAPRGSQLYVLGEIGRAHV